MVGLAVPAARVVLSHTGQAAAVVTVGHSASVVFSQTGQVVEAADAVVTVVAAVVAALAAVLCVVTLFA